MRFFICISLITVLLSCSSKERDKSYTYKKDGSRTSLNGGSELESGQLMNQKAANRKEFGNLTFGFNEVTAINYVERTGNHISAEDKKELEDESVFMLEIETKEQSIDILTVAEISMNEDDATQYLIGKVLDDFSIQQDGIKILPEGVQYDGKIGSGDKIRLVFFVQGVNLGKEYTIEYYDRLFGKGLVKMKKNINAIS